MLACSEENVGIIQDGLLKQDMRALNSQGFALNYSLIRVFSITSISCKFFRGLREKDPDVLGALVLPAVTFGLRPSF